MKALAAEVRNVEHELFSPDWTSVIQTPKTKTLGDIAQAALDNMIQQAQKRYAPHGTRLQISRHDALKAIGFDQWSHTSSRRPDKDQSAPVDLDKLHAYLEATCGGEAGETTAFKQQAKVLIDFFHFDKPDSMAVTARYVDCTVRVWATNETTAPARDCMSWTTAGVKICKMRSTHLQPRSRGSRSAICRWTCGANN